MRFSSGSSTPASRARKRSCASTCTSGTWKWPPNVSTTCAASSLPQQPVVDEDARELVADRLVHEQRRDRGVDAARERAEDALAADLRADPLDLLLDHGGGRPGRRRAGDAVEEVLQQLLCRAACARPRGGTGRRRGRARGSSNAAIGVDGEPATTRAPVGRRDDRVAVAHPDRLLARRGRRRARRLGAQLGLAELGDAGAVDAAAEVVRHQLHAVADAERRHAELEERRDRRAARRRRRPTPGRRRGSSACGLRAPHAPRPRSCAGRAPSRRAPRARGARSAASTGRRGRATSTGRSASARARRAARRPQPPAVIRRLLRDRDVVRVALAQAGAGDADERAPPSAPRSSRRRSSPSPAAGRRRAGARRPQRAPCTARGPRSPPGTSLLDVLDVALEVAVLREAARLHRAERAHAAVLLEALALRGRRRRPGLVGAGEQRAEHDRVGAGRDRLRDVAGAT